MGFTEEEEAVGAVGEEEEVEDTMVVEGEVSLVAAVSTGELSRYHFRESRKYYLVDWAGGGWGGFYLVQEKINHNFTCRSCQGGVERFNYLSINRFVCELF